MICNDSILKKIAEALLVDYTSVYYVDVKTNEYVYYSNDPKFHSLHLEQSGGDFFSDIVRDAKQVVYEEDQHIFTEKLQKDKLLVAMKKGNLQSVKYRLMIDGKPVYHLLRLIRGIEEDDDYFVFGVINIEQEHNRRIAEEKLSEEREVFNRIAAGLADSYDALYYIDAKDDSYFCFSSKDNYKSISVPERGENFFDELREKVGKYVHPEDRVRAENCVNKDYVITSLEDRNYVSVDYRFMQGDVIKYARFAARWSLDKTHFIVTREDIDNDVKREKERLEAIKLANERANKDELTGTRNRNAYHEYELSLQERLDDGEYINFGIVICDINGLKVINDTKGHKAGDEYIKDACAVICKIFAHSPVFRIGGDEFLVMLMGNDYRDRDELVTRLKGVTERNLSVGEGPIVACGLALFDARSRNQVSKVFEYADKEMYIDKASLKEKQMLRDSYSRKKKDFAPITEERRKKLDALFKAFATAAEGTYVYLCDMQYDYSRWSKTAVETFGLPSEYMYGAGDIWEEKIHPEDRDIYRQGIMDIFSGVSDNHDMQYRAQKTNGEYEVCTCRGSVIYTPDGKPDYFTGVIRNHGLIGHVDTVTGLRNQYGFFEDADAMITNKRTFIASIIGIGRFSEINEMYGYTFGNRVLQKFARDLFNFVGNYGNVYRLDGTKFALLTSTRTVEECFEAYRNLSNYYRSEFCVDEKEVVLEINGGLMTVDNFEIDYQTVYACLNFAYGESKNRRQGELIEFYDDLNDESRNRIEKLHAIRASVTRNCEGFYLLYQPVVDVHTEKLIGAEALIRWKNDKYGMVPPDLFIPLLERDPVFPDLGEWIIRQAITDAIKIREEISDFVVHVNLSYSQIERPDFVDKVSAILRETGYPAGKLCLEITERCRLLDMDLLKNVIVSLRSRGVLIALDDFGTGFSSVGTVRALPLDTIKIDRSFVCGIEDNARDRNLVENFTKVALTFGAEVCVEGIETAGMRDILRQYEVHSLQGYYYSKPLDIDQFMLWMRRNING